MASEREEVKCIHCGYKFSIGLKEITAGVNVLMTRCPECGINTPVSWMKFSNLGGDHSMLDSRT